MLTIQWLKNPKLNARCMEILLAQSSSAFISSGLGGLVLVVVFWSRTDHWVSLFWVLAYMSVASMRVALKRVYSHAQAGDKGSRRWLEAYGLCLFLTGSVWGGYLTYLIPYSQGTYSIILVVTFSALLAGAVSAYSVSLSMFVLFSLPILIPVLFGTLLNVHEDRWVLVAVILCWYLFMVSTARRFSNFAMRSLGLEYKNDKLLLKLKEQNVRAEALAAELLVLSNTDGLTGVYNRRYFDEQIRHEWRREQRSQKPISIILCDIDYFKRLNDCLGHDAGDECLIQVASALAQEVRDGTDFVARIGGEEFAVLLAEATLGDAVHLAERLADVVSGLNIKHPNSSISDKVSMCLGVASVLPTNENMPSDLLKMADEKLYTAKETGRNKIVS